MASSQALPEPMNSSPHHSKVKVTMTLPDPTFVAGAHVSGKLEMECRADRGLGIGIMMVELFAVQELSSRDHSATSTFLHSRRLFQGPGLPPSNAVQAHPMPGDPALPQHYHQARKGRSTFLFRIPIPASSPSSIAFGSGLAKVSYELRASVGVYWKNEKRLVIAKHPIDVVESCPYDEAFLGKVPEAIVVGENGKLWMQGKLVGSVILAGESACLELQVKNHSNKKNSGLTLSLVRTLYLPASATGQRQAPVQISDILTTVPYRGHEYVVPPGAEGVANLVFDVPKHARGVRGGTLDGEEAEGGTGPRHTDSLFEIKCKVEVKLTMGMGSKDIVLEIPIDVVHPSAMPVQQPILSPYAQPYSPQEPVLNSGPYFGHTPYYPPQTMSPAPPHIPYIDPVQNQVWMPPPPSIIPMSPAPLGYPYLPYSPVSPEGYHAPMQPYAVQQPYHKHHGPPHIRQNLLIPESTTHIPRPSSVGPVVSASQVPQPIVAGLPPPPAATSLLPLHVLNHPQAIALTEPFEAEVGKGDRALRVSQHLRISSRNRSVSPQSHRYPLPAQLGTVVESHALDASGVGAAVGAASNTTAQQRTPRTLPPPPLLLKAENMSTSPTHSTDGMVHSPRPQLTPKHSFTRDPILGATSKSERVEELEKMADEVAKKSQDLSCDLPKGMSDILASKENQEHQTHLKSAAKASEGNVNKTLPGPPVPSGKELLPPPSRARADLYFAQHQAPVPETKPLPSDQTPPTPALLAVHPSRHIRPDKKDVKAESGLDALERRLLAEVGTRKLDTRRVTKDKRPDIRDVLSVEDGSSPNMTSSVSIPTKSPETLHDSAISSLTLAGGLAGDDSDGEFDGRTHRAGRSRAGSNEEREGMNTGLHLHMRERAQVSTPTKTLNLERVNSGHREQESREDLDSGKSKEGKTSGKKKDRSSNKSAAKGRVAAWLGRIDPDVPPQEQIIPPSPSVARTPPSPFDIDKDDAVLSPPPPALEGLPSIEGPKDISAPPNPRSSGFVPIVTLKKDATQTRPLIARDATVVEEARRVQNIWSSEDTPVISAKAMPEFLRAFSPVPGPMSIRTDRRVSPPSSKPPPPDPRSKPLSYSAVARNVWKSPEVAKSPPVPPLPPPKTPVPTPPKKVLPAQPGRKAVFPPKPVDPDVKYDIRSARGGRGGKVAAVANLWASGAITGEDVKGKGASKSMDSNMAAAPSHPQRTGRKLFSDAVLTPALSPKRTSTTFGNIGNGYKPTDAPKDRSTEAQRRPDTRTVFPGPQAPSNPIPKKTASVTPLAPPATRFGGVGKSSKSTEALVQKRPATAMSNPYSFHSNGKTTPTSHSTPSSSDPKLHNFVAKGVKPVFKGTSDPAVVSSSHAVPTLSSTASLARPHIPATQKQPSRPVKLPTLLPNLMPTLSSGSPADALRPASPTKPVDLAFGQARIRDLIKKYQGGQGQKT